LSEISAGVIHQIGQPLTAIFNNVSAAKAIASHCSNTSCTALAALLDSDHSLKQVRLTMSRLRGLIHPELARRELKDLNAIVRVVVELIQKELGASGIIVVATLPPGLPLVAVDEVQFSQALLNILRNACEAVAECGPDRRKVTACTQADGSGWLTVEVCDRGPGIAPANLDRLFEPFFTTKPDGMGVGLSLCRRIIQAHGGNLAAGNNKDGPGATFRIRLPVVKGGSA
jgi:signal transduction histidine kinase